MWAGVAMSRYFDIARIAYDDLCGKPEPEPVDMLAEMANLTDLPDLPDEE